MTDAAPAVQPRPRPTGGPEHTWPHRALYERVLNAIQALPSLFETSLRIGGIRATDLHTLSGALGASIEKSAVESLNQLRPIWDPQGEYRLYSFVQQAQSWPDVLLRTEATNVNPKPVWNPFDRRDGMRYPPDMWRVCALAQA